MAHRLVFGGVEEQRDVQPVAATVPPTRNNPLSKSERKRE